MTIKPDWIAVDWGTSNLRVWGMSGDTVLNERSSADGMGALAPHEFEPALLKLIDDWLTYTPITIVACGMVGARQGWAEAKYLTAPTKPHGGRATYPKTNDPRLNVHILPGVQQPDPADVMRGEETQTAGYIAQNKEFDGILCLPGTHTKWARISAEEIVSFQTYMTGEMFALLSERSVLRHSVQSDDMDIDVFQNALNDIISRPERLATRLFSIRAETLLNDLDATTARSRLSGMLLGAELSAARPYWLGLPVTLIGDAKLTDLYAAALKSQGVTPKIATTNTVLQGLIAAHSNLQETT